MEVMVKVLKYVSLLAILIASSASESSVIEVIERNRGPQTVESRMAEYRLPNHTIPRAYTISIEPDMISDDFTWYGKTSIEIDILYPTRTLTLHAHHNLFIIKMFTKLVDASGTALKPIKHTSDVLHQFLTLTFDRQLTKGSYNLNLKFEGTETWQLLGMFRSQLSDGTTMVGTHFQPTSARLAFPCWDEPAFKAQFRIFIKHSSNYTALSNMPEMDTSDTADGKIMTSFETTPLLSPHFLEFMVTENNNEFNKHRNPGTHEPRGVAGKVNLILDFSPKVVQVMESYTGHPFGFLSIGSVLMPVYLKSEVEHWDLIPYGESMMNGNLDMTTTAEEEKSMMLVAHELSHSWFGNRVTPHWWNDLWLSEAFAVYFQYYILDQIYPNWRSMELFVVSNNREISFLVDDVENIPVRWTPITNNEIQRIFKPITYRKGAAIIHMFRNVLGDVVFHTGMQEYINKYSLKTSVTEDLTKELQEAYDKSPKKRNLNVTKAMTSWLEQKGYPIVNVTRNYQTGQTIVSQRSSLSYTNHTSSKWWIPLTYATQSDPNFSSTSPTEWITNEQESRTIDGIDKNDWIIFNVQASGYYRVAYDTENWNRIVKYLDSDNYKNIHVLNRVQLIDDAFYLAHHEPNKYYLNFYKLIKYLWREDEYLPWRVAISAIKKIEASLPRNSDEYRLLQHNTLQLVAGFIAKVGFEVRDTDDHFMNLSRTDVIDWACKAGQVDCVRYAAQKILDFARDRVNNPLHADIKGWIFCAGLKGLSESEAESFVTWAYKNEKSLLIKQIGCTDNHVVHRILLDEARKNVLAGNSNEMISVMDALLLSSNENFNYVVDYFVECHQTTRTSSDVLTAWWHSLADVLIRIVDGVKTKDRLEKLEKVIQLDVVSSHQFIDKARLMDIARKNVDEGNAASNEFRQFCTYIL